jgi:hypothetical protein
MGPSLAAQHLSPLASPQSFAAADRYASFLSVPAGGKPGWPGPLLAHVAVRRAAALINTTNKFAVQPDTAYPTSDLHQQADQPRQHFSFASQPKRCTGSRAQARRQRTNDCWPHGGMHRIMARWAWQDQVRLWSSTAA